MSTPDFTPAALTALLVSAATAGIVLFKLDLTDAQQGALTALIAAVCTLGYFIHDAIVRHGRAGIAAAKLTAQSPPPAPDDPPVVEPDPPIAPPRRPRRRTKPAA